MQGFLGSLRWFPAFPGWWVYLSAVTGVTKSLKSRFPCHLLGNRFALRNGPIMATQINWVFWKCLALPSLFVSLMISGCCWEGSWHFLTLNCTGIEVEGTVSSLWRWSFGLSCSSVWSIWRLGRLVVRHGVIAYDWMLGSRGIALQIRNEDTWRP